MPLGKVLIVTGLILVVLGAAVWAFGSVPMLGRLPGACAGGACTAE